MVIATKCCALCGNTFTWTSRNPNRRFCDPRCKARWWRERNPREAAPAEVVFDPADEVARAATSGLSVHACPHCGHVINLIELLLAADDIPAAM